MAVLLNVAVGIMRVGDLDNSQIQARCNQIIHGTDGGVLAGLICVKAKDNFFSIAFEQGRVLQCQCGALRGNDVFDPSHVAGNQIELSFANDGRFGLQDGSLGLVEPVDGMSLLEELCFGRVDVFADLGVTLNKASAEGNATPLYVMYGEHEPPPETVIVILSGLFLEDQTSFFQKWDIVVFTPRPAYEMIPTQRGIPQLKMLDGFE